MKKIYALFSLFIFCTTGSLHAQMAHVPNELLVQFKPGTDPKTVIDDYRTLGDMETGLTLGKLLSKTMNIYRLHYNDSQISGREMLITLRKDRAVAIAQYNHYVFPRENFPDDPQFGSQWHHNNTGQSGGTVGADIGSGLAWEITTGGVTALGDTIVVCVIEGGNLNHPDLVDNAWVNHGEIPNNGIDDDGNGYVDDYYGWNVQAENDEGVFLGGHGTRVMGMIGAKGGNGLGVVGANWDIKIMSVAGQSANNEASVVEAYNYALVQRQIYDTSNGESGAFVVATNASWGIDNGDPDDVPIWTAFYDTLGTYGILNCGATANNNVNIDLVGDIPTAAPSDYMISVTATNHNDIRTFSAYGVISVDLGAPGSNVFTTSGDAGYGNTSGTSFASPLTAGVIGLMYSVPCESFAQLAKDDPQAAADSIRMALFQGVDPVPNLEGQTVTGGRLNAFNSLSILLDNCEDPCLAPFGFNYTVSNDTVFSFDWTEFGGGEVAIRFREVGAEEWNLMEGIEEGPFIVDSLLLCTPYEFQIAAACSEEAGELSFGESTTVETLGCCVATTELLTADTTEMSVALSWVHGFNIEAYEVYYRVEGTSIWNQLGTFEDGEADLDGLESCTYYELLVKPACAEDFEEGVEATIRTKDCGACIDNLYCTSLGENTNDEFIDLIEIGEYINQSGNDDGYALFEDTGLELVPGDTYEVTLTPGFTGTNFNEFFRVWIDTNQDGEFTNDEILMSSSNASPDPVNDTITIPVDALPGSTRLRVVMKYIGFGSTEEPTACAIVEYGETEDYCITIADSIVTSTTNENFTRFAVYPNPGNGIFNFEYDLIPGKGQSTVILSVFDITGKQVKQTLFNSPRNTLNMQGLEDGMYLYNMAAPNGEVLKSGKLLLVR